MSPPAEEPAPRVNSCDLLSDIARLQAETARSFAAWAAAYEAAAKAAEATVESLTLMAEVGRRTEAFMGQGNAAAAQTVQPLTQPWQLLGTPFSGMPGTTGVAPHGTVISASSLVSEKSG